MKQVLTAFCLLLAAGILTPASAQRIDSPYRFLDHSQHVGAFGGHVAASTGQLELGPQPGPVFGGRWGIRVTGPFSAGVEVGFMPTTRIVRDTVIVPADSTYLAVGEADVRLLSVMGTLSFSLTGPRTWYGLRPFLSAGIGGASDLAGAAEAEAEFEPDRQYNFGTSFAGMFGGGVEWYPTQRVSVRVDGRNMMWKLRNPDAFGLTDPGFRVSRSDWASNYSLLAGLSFHF